MEVEARAFLRSARRLRSSCTAQHSTQSVKRGQLAMRPRGAQRAWPRVMTAGGWSLGVHS